MRRPRPKQVVTNRCSLSGGYGPDEWPLSPGQCRVHETGIKMICEYILQDGRRLGTRRVSSIDTTFVDQLFEKLLFKEVNGKKIERRTTVNHAMKTARTAWNAISRAHPGLFPPRDPFARMGLQSNSRETPHAHFSGASCLSRESDREGLHLACHWSFDRLGAASARSA
jgi:hypothetical protein